MTASRRLIWITRNSFEWNDWLKYAVENIDKAILSRKKPIKKVLKHSIVYDTAQTLKTRQRIYETKIKLELKTVIINQWTNIKSEICL